jgi:hypothetical protein
VREGTEEGSPRYHSTLVLSSNKLLEVTNNKHIYDNVLH